MNKKVKMNSIRQDHGFDIVSVELPIVGKCPICDTAYGEEPVAVYKYKRRGETSHAGVASATFLCPHCERLFNANYVIDNGVAGVYGATLIETFPTRKSDTEFSEDIKTISLKFAEIYEQAESAENQGLSEICGMGYRKALEFLVKDYVIKINPEDEEKIKEIRLATCIEQYIENSSIKTLAKASAWLGNDETHYVRKHEDYNLEHLKLFINSMVRYIDSELAVTKAQELIGNK